MNVIKAPYLLLMYLLTLLLEHFRGNYVGNSDWPNRPLAEYITERDGYYKAHLEDKRLDK